MQRQFVLLWVSDYYSSGEELVGSYPSEEALLAAIANGKPIGICSCYVAFDLVEKKKATIFSKRNAISWEPSCA